MKPITLKQYALVFAICLAIGAFAGYFVGFITR